MGECSVKHNKEPNHPPLGRVLGVSSRALARAGTSTGGATAWRGVRARRGTEGMVCSDWRVLVGVGVGEEGRLGETRPEALPRGDACVRQVTCVRDAAAIVPWGCGCHTRAAVERFAGWLAVLCGASVDMRRLAAHITHVRAFWRAWDQTIQHFCCSTAVGRILLALRSTTCTARAPYPHATHLASPPWVP